ADRRHAQRHLVDPLRYRPRAGRARAPPARLQHLLYGRGRRRRAVTGAVRADERFVQRAGDDGAGRAGGAGDPAAGVAAAPGFAAALRVIATEIACRWNARRISVLRASAQFSGSAAQWGGQTAWRPWPQTGR